LLSFFSVFNSDPTIELLIALDLKAEPPGREATMKTIQAALYARVSSEQQAAAHTIESQLAALTERARSDGTPVPVERQFVDEGFSGATLVRPALNRLRDLTATGVIKFEDAIFHTSTLLRYLGMLVGRPQNLLKLSLRVESDLERSVFFEVYWSMPPKREPLHEDGKPHPSDVLLDAVRQPEGFSRVLENWLDRQHAWHDARLRFSNSLAEQQRYGIDRLIGSANMFDILPSSAVPPDVQLVEELKEAKEAAREIFAHLPQSPERDSILGALGRIGKSSLKQKIRHRAQRLIGVAGERFPELLTVTDEAVNCRNHYVHGSAPRFDYNRNFDIVAFFIDTLEFVFATSDLIEAGWI
jgi:hypothetical protein